MFRKQAVCISTAAGAGMKSTNKDMADSMFFWGVGKTYKYGVAVRETAWNRVSHKTKNRVERKTTALAHRIRKNHGRVKPSVKTRVIFSVMRMLQKAGWNEADRKYWEEKGWIGKRRPWHT